MQIACRPLTSGEYSHMGQLHCEFLYDPTPETFEADPVGIKVWYSDV